MDNPKISVIVPVYNAEKYLHRCIDSILAQTFTDFELLLIDDGSTDKSAEICARYALLDQRVNICKKYRGGVSEARQYGLDHAQGDYIQFVDSDDWIEQTCLEDNFQIAEAHCDDIVIDNFYSDCDGTIMLKKQVYSGNLITDMFSGNVFGALWNKFFRAETIKNAGTCFGYGLSFCEDFVFICELWQKAKGLKIAMNDKAYYHYCANTDSLTRKLTLSGVRNEEKYIKVMTSIIPDLTPDRLYPNKLSVRWGYLRLGVLTFKQYKRLYPELPLSVMKMGRVKRLLLVLAGNGVCYAVIKGVFRLLKR